MADTTYATSQQCYNAAGSKGTVGSGWPTVAMVDDFRSEAFSDIAGIIVFASGEGALARNNAVVKRMVDFMSVHPC